MQRNSVVISEEAWRNVDVIQEINRDIRLDRSDGSFSSNENTSSNNIKSKLEPGNENEKENGNGNENENGSEYSGHDDTFFESATR